MSIGSLVKRIKKAEPLLITPKIIEFLDKNPEGAIWDDAGYALFKQIVEAGKGNDASSRAGRWGASSRGTCLRRQVFTFLGMPGVRIIEPELQNLFNDGKWRHIRWQMMGVQSGALTHAEYPVVRKKDRLKVSVDGLNADEKFIFELKGDRNWSRVMDGVPDAHDLQIHTMLYATGWHLAAYVIEDKSSQQWREIIVHRDESLIEKVKTELGELNAHVDDKRLPRILPACQAKEGPYRTCPFAPVCLQRDEEGDPWPDEPGDWNS